MTLKVNGTASNAGGSVASTDITDSTSTGRAVLTAASQAAARSAMGLGAVLDPSTGTITNTGAVTGTKSASAFVASIPVGAAVNDKSVDVIPWPSTADMSVTITARLAFSVAGAGHQTGLVLLRFGGSASRTIAVIADENGNVTYRLDGADIVGTTAGTPRTTTWVRIRISGDRVTMWTSSSSRFQSAAYTTTYSWLITDGTTAYATLAALELTGDQVTATATGASTVTFDNITITQGT